MPFLTDIRSGFYDELFPVEAVWASTLFLIIGGGSPVLNSVAMAMVADAVTPEKRFPPPITQQKVVLTIHRTSAFFYVSTTNLMVELLAPPLGGMCRFVGEKLLILKVREVGGLKASRKPLNPILQF